MLVWINWIIQMVTTTLNLNPEGQHPQIRSLDQVGCLKSRRFLKGPLRFFKLFNFKTTCLYSTLIKFWMQFLLNYHSYRDLQPHILPSSTTVLNISNDETVPNDSWVTMFVQVPWKGESIHLKEAKMDWLNVHHQTMSFQPHLNKEPNSFLLASKIKMQHPLWNHDLSSTIIPIGMSSNTDHTFSQYILIGSDLSKSWVRPQYGSLSKISECILTVIIR